MDIVTINGLPRLKGLNRQFTEEDLRPYKYNNQFAFEGASIDFTEDVIAFIEVIVPDASGVVLQDANSKSVSGTMTAPLQPKTPIRMDGGFKFTGTCLLVEGFYIDMR